MDAIKIWWIVTGALVIAELGSGTFYLLMIALGAASGALMAHLGLPVPVQITAAASMAALMSIALQIWRKRVHPVAAEPSMKGLSETDLELDIGHQVHVSSWDLDGTASVNYRGTPWRARMNQNGEHTPPTAGAFRIAAIQNNHLIIEKV